MGILETFNGLSPVVQCFVTGAIMVVAVVIVICVSRAIWKIMAALFGCKVIVTVSALLGLSTVMCIGYIMSMPYTGAMSVAVVAITGCKIVAQAIIEYYNKS